MKRLATTIAVAALALGASATASARLPIEDEAAAVAPSTVQAVLPAKTKAPAKKDTRPATVIYLGKH